MERYKWHTIESNRNISMAVNKKININSRPKGHMTCSLFFLRTKTKQFNDGSFLDKT